MQCREKTQKSLHKRRNKARVAVGNAGTSSATSNKHARPTRLAGQELAPGRDSYRRLWDFFLISFQQRFISRGFWGPATLLGARGLTHEGPAPSWEPLTWAETDRAETLRPAASAQAPTWVQRPLYHHRARGNPSPLSSPSLTFQLSRGCTALQGAAGCSREVGAAGSTVPSDRGDLPASSTPPAAL